LNNLEAIKPKFPAQFPDQRLLLSNLLAARVNGRSSGGGSAQIFAVLRREKFCERTQRK